MLNPLSDQALSQIFKKSTRNPALIGTNEGVTVEYKESFGWKSVSDYLKTMASFANREGGYLIFGIKDKPHLLIGLQTKALTDFENIDNQLWSTHLRECFSPEIVWEKRVYIFEGNTYGIIYTYSAKAKPIICKKDISELRRSAIYYRYNSQNSEIDYPELYAIIEEEKNKINEQWMSLIRQIGDSGVAKTALLDLKSGKLIGKNTTLYIDENLLDEIDFVQEGSFVETGGNPALKLVGEVQTIVGAQKVVVEKNFVKAINADEIIVAFITHEKVNNPMEYIKQICYQSTGNLPVYYFMTIANKSIEESKTFLDNVPTNSAAKDLLKRRIINSESKYLKLSDTETIATRKKKEYRQSFLEEVVIIPKEENNLKYCLLSLRSIEAPEIRKHKNYILNILYEIYTNYFNQAPFSSLKSEFRNALCWVDEALYME